MTEERVQKRVSEMSHKQLEMAPPPYAYQAALSFVLLLDLEGRIVSVSPQLADILERREEELISTRFDTLLNMAQQQDWDNIMEQVSGNMGYQTIVQLDILASSGKIIPCCYSITRVFPLPYIMLGSFTAALQDVIPVMGTRKQTQTKRGDAVLVGKIRDYIMNHLDEPLPSMQRLSQLFHTNEFKLKKAFRAHFNTSIYQFYNDERLKRAHLLILEAFDDLKAIAMMSGFNDYVNFRKAFRKKFGYTPSSLRRKGK